MFDNERAMPEELRENLSKALSDYVSEVRQLSFKYKDRAMPNMVRNELHELVLHYRNGHISAKRIDDSHHWILYISGLNRIMCESLIRLKIDKSPITYQGVNEINEVAA